MDLGASQQCENLAKKGPFWKIQHLQIKIYPKISIEPKYDDFYSNNKVSDHGLSSPEKRENFTDS